jgi:hypothetical protein
MRPGCEVVHLEFYNISVNEFSVARMKNTGARMRLRITLMLHEVVAAR